MKSKKGIGVGQVFIFIVAAITFSLIMIFGYKYVTDFIDKGEQVEFVKFKNDLESSIKKIYTEYGAVRVKEYNMPAKYEQICFVDMDYDYNEELKKLDFRAADLWEDANVYNSVEQNVFTKPASEVKIKVFDISIAEYDDGNKIEDKGFICRNVTNGRFTLTLEGKGDHTELSK